MPLRKKIPILKDLCIDNIIRNILLHGEMFKRHRDQANEEIYDSYKTLQFLFSDDLLQRLLVLLFWESEDENLRLLRDVTFESEKKPECNRYWPCLEMFFNEYTSAILPHWRLVSKYNILDSMEVSNIFRCFMQDRLYDAIPRFQNLKKVNLAYPGGSEALKKILEACPLIQYLSAEVCDTDLLFLSLCKYHTFQEEFVFCRENGECSKAGKHLEHLHVKLNETTANGAGIACALQHLPLLKSFYPLPLMPILFSGNYIFPDVLKGICTLQNAAIHSGKEQLTLKLSVLYFDTDLNPRELRALLMSCPYLESIYVHLSVVHPRIFTLGSFKNLKELCLLLPTNKILSSTELKELLSAQGEKIEAIIFKAAHSVDLALINKILNSLINLKRLSLDCIHIQDRNYNDITGMPSCIAKLEDIFLEVSTIACPPFPQYHGYFCDLLSNAKSLTRLTIGSNFAKQVFLNALDKTGFQNLQKLVVSSEKAADFPYLRLLDAKNSLSSIIFRDRQEKKPNVASCIQFVRHNNYDVEFIEGVENH